MEKIEVAVYMADPDVKKWMLFQEFYTPFSIMVEKNVFGQKNATISLNFDKDGLLRSIDRKDILYSSRYE